MKKLELREKRDAIFGEKAHSTINFSTLGVLPYGGKMDCEKIPLVFGTRQIETTLQHVNKVKIQLLDYCISPHAYLNFAMVNYVHFSSLKKKQQQRCIS